ncbi:putative ABC transporter permease subunit [Maledivibacter halophilus]|uniref:ABC-2 type transport system permease protein n=1 Tax=Maledivibacter halophilus TaxID=36842 RepID=A0A1T5MN26_9FIRM|nr:hypothetical protein [Maledivibacter halophilus]SKC89414.1 ABC-2 type transport system permease protein [Maledivibacter halophilus]
MNKIYLLAKTFLKNRRKEKYKRNNKISSWLSKLLLFGFLIFLGIPLIGFISETYDFLASINQQGLLVNIAFSIATVVIFVFGISFVLTTFYFTKDIDILLPLPLKPYEIVSAKFITVLIYEYLTELLVLGPLLVVYGYKGSLGLGYWTISIVIFLILPIIPLVLASVLNMIIMRFTNLGKHKDTLKTIAAVFSLIIGIGVNILYRSNKVSKEKMIEMLTSGDNSLVGIVSTIFPTTNWATYSLIGKSISEIALNLILFVLASALSIAIFIFAAQKLYFKGVIGGSESFAKRKKLDKRQIEKSTKQSSKFKVYTLKEMKILFRTPVFLISCVISNLIYPILLAIGIFTNIDSYFSMATIRGFFANKEFVGIVIAMSFAIAFFIGGSNRVASTAISREGQNMYINKYIPMSYKEQIFSKLFSAIIIDMINILLIILILIFMVKIPLVMAVFILIASLLANTISSSIGIIIDINNPNLSWDNEQKAVKQNRNTFASGIISLVMSGLITFFTIRFKPDLTIASISIGAISLFIITSLFYYISTKGQKAYSKI